MNRRIALLVIVQLVLLLCVPLISSAQKKQKTLRDTLDNALDISYYLNNLHGFLPIISPITEPAVGYGAAVAGLFFIPHKKSDTKKFQLPDVVGAAGGLTQNKTWFAAVGYAGFWKHDRIRYRGALGYVDVKLKYYGRGEDYLDENPAEFRLRSYLLLQQAIFRIGESRFLLGGRYQLMKIKATFFEESKLPGVDSLDSDLLNSSLGLIAEYENFNNLFSPTKGLRINLTYDQYLKILGSDRDFGHLGFFLLFYQPVFIHKWIAGFRVDSQMATGDPPFYMMPFLSLRGVPALRYQGKLTALIETEQEVMLTKRWSMVAFGGYGAAIKSFDEMDKKSTAWNAGAGFRYLIARLFGLKMGLDVARGPEQWAVYIVVGSSWAK
jgi:hypothetical protein